MGLDQIRTFLLPLMDEEQSSASTVASQVAALRFFYGVTLGRPEVAVQIPYPKVPHTLPDILSSQEVMALLDALGSVKYRAVVATMYAAGLRISEVCALKPADIDSQRMLIHVRLGKRGRDRFVMLSQKLLELLRIYWTMARPPGIYLLTGVTKRGHVGPKAVRHALREAARCTWSALSSAPALHRYRRRSVAGWDAGGGGQHAVSVSGRGALGAVSGSVLGRTQKAHRARPGALGRAGAGSVAGYAVSAVLGRIRQAALWRTGAGLPVPWTIYASGGNLQSAPDLDGRARGLLCHQK